MTERMLDWSLEVWEDVPHVKGSQPRCIVVHSPITTDVRQWYAAQPLAAMTPHIIVDGAGSTVDTAPLEALVVSEYAAVAPLGLVLIRDSAASPYTECQLNAAAQVVVDWWLTIGFVPLLALWQIYNTQREPSLFDWPAFHNQIHRALQRLDRSGRLRTHFLTFLQSPAQSQQELLGQLRLVRHTDD